MQVSVTYLLSSSHT